MRQAKPWSARWLKGRCEEFRASLLKRRTATAEEIEAYWPGGKVNNEADGHGKWIFCYANMIRLLGKREPSLELATSGNAMAGALASEAAIVKFEDGAERPVYPKSFHALRWLDTLDVAVRDVVDAIAEYGQDPEFLNALAVTPLLESVAVRTWAWVLTTGDSESTAALPFDDAQPLDPPAWTKTITGRDILALLKAHVTVNAEQLRIIAAAFPAEPNSESRLSLGGFLGTAAQELGVRPAQLLRRFSLAEVFAMSVASAQASREARERAEQKAKAG